MFIQKAKFYLNCAFICCRRKNISQLHCESKQNNHDLCKNQKLTLMINKKGGGLSSAIVSPMLILKSIGVEADERIEWECRTSELEVQKDKYTKSNGIS